MNYKDKTKEQLINESAELQQRIEDLKAIETKHIRAEFVIITPAINNIKSVILESKARRESFRKDSGQAGMTEIWNCGRDISAYILSPRRLLSEPSGLSSK